MKKLIQGIVEFRKNLTPEKRALFADLALGQKPDTLFIACSDSRVVPNLFASTNPGDLFVLRNVGNLIPPPSFSSLDSSAWAVIEFSVFFLNVRDIIVCGHSECGAMKALLGGIDGHAVPHLESWLHYGIPALEKIRNGDFIDTVPTLHDQLSRANVLQQIEHLKAYPSVAERLKEKKLRLHGWWFDIAGADVYCYEEEEKKFVLIDEKEAERLLKRAHSGEDGIPGIFS